MTKSQVNLAEYTAPSYLAKELELVFELGDVTKVQSKVRYVRNDAKAGDLLLNGEQKPANMRCLSVKVNNKTLDKSEFAMDEESLTIPGRHLGEDNIVEIDVSLEPAKNTSLSGLYVSDGAMTTQCEAEGFRNITYMLDRPDVMAKYTATVIGDKTKYPYLLSNGNDVERGELGGGRHYVKWVDPWPKPTYLFALVAGDFAVQRDTFVTSPSGTQVKLAIFVDHHNAGKTSWAMESLKNAMRWDEQRFDREYDLEQFNIVAVDSFNMGAMENKSLNIFNSRCILADPNTQTDADYRRIEAIVGHEYFHNYSGNRVTCRDWFQLTLKEGLTVFRDAEFTADLNSRVEKRVEDVKFLREEQFPEALSPISHPIQPESYIEIDNFYTATVYEYGAEVIRMMQTMCGVDGFRAGLNLYFDRHDGQAVTCQDFCKAIQDANPQVDLAQFERTWYKQNGVVRLEVSHSYDEKSQELTLSVRQSSEAPQLPDKWEPFDIPLAVGLIGAASKQPIASFVEAGTPPAETLVLRVTQKEQTFVLGGVTTRPIPSLLRDFSAPVRLVCPTLSLEDLSFLAAHDTDEFVRYDSLQGLATQTLQQGIPPTLLIGSLRSTLERSLAGEPLDKAVVAMTLSLPDEHELSSAAAAGGADVAATIATCQRVASAVAQELGPLLRAVYYANSNEEEPAGIVGDAKKAFMHRAATRRALKNAALKAMVDSANPDAPHTMEARRLALEQFSNAANMTDRMGAIAALNHTACPERKLMLERFVEMHRSDRLVMNKYFTLVASSGAPNTLESVKAIVEQGKAAGWSIENPNCCYALIKSFANNFSAFHAQDGQGYQFVADMILRLDKINPQVASRIAKTMSGWRLFKAPWSTGIQSQLERLAREDLSSDVFEIVSKSIGERSN